MQARISLPLLAVLLIIPLLAMAQSGDFTAEVTHTLSPGETREDAHVFAATEARFEVVDQLVEFARVNFNLSAKKLSPDNERMFGFMLGKTYKVQDEWLNDSTCKVTFQTQIDTTFARKVLKEWPVGSNPYKGKGNLNTYRQIVDSLKLITRQTAQGIQAEADHARLLEEYNLMEISEKSRGLDNTAKIAYFSETLKTRPSCARFFAARADAYLGDKQYDLAIKDYNQAIKIEPENFGYLLGRASTYRTLSLDDKAIADYQRVLQLDPQNTRAYTSLAQIYNNQGNMDLAEKNYLKAVELDAKDRFSLNMLGFIYLRTDKQDFDKALKYYNLEIEAAPDLPSGYTGRGYVHIVQRQFDQAITDFSKALELDPEWLNGINYTNRGNAYLQKGDLEKARADLEKAAKLGSEQAEKLLRQLPLTK